MESLQSKRETSEQKNKYLSNNETEEINLIFKQTTNKHKKNY